MGSVSSLSLKSNLSTSSPIRPPYQTRDTFLSVFPQKMSLFKEEQTWYELVVICTSLLESILLKRPMVNFLIFFEC